MPQLTAKRTRNAAATRAAILVSARRAFARAGYNGVGVREIAEGAGVTAMLVNRYFGSKEGLFGAVVADSMRDPAILTDAMLAAPDAAAMARSLVAITAPSAAPLDGFLLLLRSASSAEAGEICRHAIEGGHQQALAGALTGAHAEERAALVLSLVAGVQAMRQMVGLTALAEAKPDVLTALIAPLLRQLLAA